MWIKKTESEAKRIGYKQLHKDERFFVPCIHQSFF
jgi:hypothetical protein